MFNQRVGITLRQKCCARIATSSDVWTYRCVEGVFRGLNVDCTALESRAAIVGIAVDIMIMSDATAKKALTF